MTHVQVPRASEDRAFVYVDSIRSFVWWIISSYGPGFCLHFRVIVKTDCVAAG